jgi:phosphatidylglycerol:prolipoprotein diacylglycerol transferase
VLAQVGPFTLYTYTLLIDLGLAVGLAALYLRAPAGRGPRWLDAGLAAIVGGFLGARLLYVIVNGDFYFPNIDEIVQVWRGGLAWPGAAAGALLGAWVYTSRKRERLAPILDVLAFPIVLLGLLGWGGCLAAGCAYGYEVAPGELPGWLTTTAPDLFGLSVPRFATQRVGLAWSALTLLFVWSAERGRGWRWPTGALGAYALSLVALGAFGLGFTRGDPAPLVAGYRADVAGSAVVLLAATVAWAMSLLRGASHGPMPHSAAGSTAPTRDPESPRPPESPEPPEAARGEAPYPP